MSKVKITVDGVTFEGEKDAVRDLLEATGKAKKGVPYYYSLSRGFLPVSEMHTGHVKNALLKIYREWVDSLSDVKDPQTLTRMIYNGPDSMDWANLFRELKSRHDVLK